MTKEKSAKKISKLKIPKIYLRYLAFTTGKIVRKKAKIYFS